MKGFYSDLERATLENENFRKVIFTGPNLQLVLMTLKMGEEIGLETHDTHDQFIRVEKGMGRAVIAGEEFSLVDGSAIVVPAGAEHNVINTGSESMRLYTVYAPPQHPDGTIHATKAEAEEAEESEE